MKLALTLEADSVNVQALNMGRIVVDVDGVELAELINVVCDNGYSLRVVDESDRTSTDSIPPSAALSGIRCSTAHITAKYDNFPEICEANILNTFEQLHQNKDEV
ncbi:DUF5983 family protein, partial [Escherichia coli]